MAFSPDSAAAADIHAAAAALRAGELVAFPTETVYGLGADASQPQALAALYALKGRPTNHPVIVHIASADMIDAWAVRIPAYARALATQFWPGPMTLILPRAAHVLDAVTGGQAAVGLRVPAHPLAQALLRAHAGGVAAPSANRFGHVSPTTAAHVRAEFGDAVQVLDGGPCEVGIESTIVDCTGPTPHILRPGAITLAMVEACAQGIPVKDAHGMAVSSHSSVKNPMERESSHSNAPKPASNEHLRHSGGLESHYAPTLPARLVEDVHHRANAHRAAVFSKVRPADAHAWLAAPSDATVYAQCLYATLRELDGSGAQEIWVETPPEGPAWAGVRDRLAKATAPRG
jgi:L-threonylcarbamoyladenylate synthase